MGKRYRRAVEEYLAGHAPRPLKTRSFGPKTAGLALAELADYPSRGATTWVTMGLAQQQRSSWRGLPLGHELVLTLVARDAEVVRMVMDAVLEDRRGGRGQANRRPMIEYNGVWAPGYPPHLLFIESPVVPALMVREKLDDRYVQFLAAVPIDDRELRLYDRDPAGFVAELSTSGGVMRFPRG